MVSVIVPTYNRSHLIDRAINSILTQTYQDFEIIVVDDCSEDDLETKINEFDDSRIKLIRHKKKKGGSAARNTGIEAARSKFIAFLDDDDEWLPTKLEKQMKIFDQADQQLGVVTCARSKFEGDKKILDYTPECKGDVYQYLINTWKSFGTSTMVIKKSFLKQTGYFDEELRSHQELDLLIRLAKICDFDFVDEVLINNHIYPDRIGGNIYNGISGKEMVLTKIQKEMAKTALSRHRLELGQYYAFSGDIARAKKEFIKAMKAFPLNWKTYIHFLIALTGLDNYLKFAVSRDPGAKDLIVSR